MDNDHDDALLKKSDLERWERECAEIDEKISALQIQKAETAQRLEAARVFLRSIGRSADLFAVSMKASVTSKPTLRIAKRRKVSWTGEISRILEEMSRPVAYIDLRSEIDKGPLAERLTRSDKGFYGAVGKLEAAGDLVKYKGWLFAPNVFKAFKTALDAGERGDLEDVTHQRSSPMGNRVLKILNEHPEGIEGRALIAELKRDPAFSDVIIRNATSAYNVFSRLLRRGEIQKEGRKYYPLKENGPPEGGPSAEEVDASSNSNPGAQQH